MLVIEDNVPLRQLMADVLAIEGYSVTEAASALELPEVCEANGDGALPSDCFDLIVSDIFMPGKNGLNALSDMRRAGVRSPLLIVTSFPDVVAYEYVEKNDAQLLAKPFTLNEFRNVTGALLMNGTSAISSAS